MKMKYWRYPAVILPGLVVWLMAVSVLQAAPVETKSDTRTELTVYNENLALVKEQRYLEIPAGISSLNFTDVASEIDPTSVQFTAVNSSAVRVLEQNYEYDVLNDAKLLQKYLGAKIKITDAQNQVNEGYLLGAGENLILGSSSSGGQVTVVKANQIKAICFPELPNGLVIRPTLVWLLQNSGTGGRRLTEITYLTGGISWKADYVATIDADDSRVDLTGWVTLNNQSGARYQNARLKLVAGDVHRVSTDQRNEVIPILYRTSKMESTSDFTEEALFEYHLYTMNRLTNLNNNQIKQVELLNKHSIPAKKLLIYEAAVDGKKIRTMLEFKNSTANGLGIPLPKGIIRVEKADGEGSLQFIGEDRIDHTPKDENVRINLGNAFDIIGERVRTQVKELAKNLREESYQITLRNHKPEVVTVTVIENISQYHESKVTMASHNYQRTSAGKLEFDLKIPAGGEERLTYTIRYKL